MPAELARYAALIREHASAMVERFLSAGAGPVAAGADLRGLWRDVAVGTLERLAQRLEGRPLVSGEDIRPFVARMQRLGITLRDAVAGQEALCGELASLVAARADCSRDEALGVMAASREVLGAGLDAYLRYAEDVFRRERDELTESIAGMGVVVFRAAPDSRIVQVNAAGAEFLGASGPGDLVGRRFADFYADPRERAALLEALRERGQVTGFRFRLRRLDGQERWAETNIRMRTGPDGRPEALDGFARDITDTVRIESERRIIEKMLDELPIALFQVDRQGVITAMNRGGVRILGAGDVGDMVGRPVTSFYADPAEREGMLAELERVGELSGYRLRVRHADGHVFWTELFLRAVRDADGSLAGTEGFLYDVSELAEVQQALDTERHRLQHVVGSLGAGLSLLDRELNIVWVNEQLSSWFGPLEEIRGRKCHEVYHRADRPCAGCPSLQTLRSGEPCTADVSTGIFGGERIFRLTTTPVRDRQGQLAHVLELTQDVTAEKRAEEERQRTSELLAGILRSAAEYALVATDADGTISYFSEGAEVLIGVRAAEVVGRAHIRELWLPESRRRVTADLEELARTGRYDDETELLRSQGLAFNARISGSARRTPDGGLAGYTFVIRDVTEERAARKMVTLMAHALESSREGVVLTDMSGVITYVNPAVTVLTGRGAADMLGRDLSILYPEDFSGEEVRAIARATLAGGWSGEVDGRRADGARFPMHLTTSLVRDERGRAVAMVALVRDITREKSLQKRLFEQEQRHLSELEQQVRERTAELERAYRDLQKLDAMKDRFLTNISHELRTPLVSGVGYIELILQEGLGPITDEIRRGLRVAHRNLLRLVNLIDDLLAFTRLESGREAMVISRFGLEQMITDCLLDLKVRASKAGLRVEMDVEKGLPPVEADEENVHRVFTNLLANAEKFTGEDALIRVVARRVAEDRVEVRVEDNGVGIPEEELDHVFDRFYRSRRTQSTRYGGTGIGLSLVKEILASHGCTVRAESPGGQGTAVIFTLPLARSGAERAPAAAPGQEVRSRRTASILVVDDDPEVHELLRTVFAATGDRMLSAAGGEEGLRLAAREDLDLIFLDVSMDGTDGVEVLRQLRLAERTSDIPVYMLTARADDRTALESRQAGATGFITKPFALSEVRGVIEDALAGSSPGEPAAG